MTTRIGINGFGRIGRQTLKAMLERHPDELEVVAINDLADTKTNAHLFRTTRPTAASTARCRRREGAITIDGHEIRAFSEKDPPPLPWGDLGVEIVIESTGIFTDATKAQAHLATPARRR